MGRAIKLMLVLGILGLSYVLIVSYYMAAAAQAECPPEADYVLVLGAGLHNGNQLSLSLLYRLEVALKYLRDNPNTNAILCGGKGPDELITEAAAMHEYLLSKGVSNERLILEEDSTSTNENLKNAKAIIADPSAQVAIVSSDFHIFRARMLAKRHNINAYVLPAKTPSVIKPRIYLREYLAIVKSLVFDW